MFRLLAGVKVIPQVLGIVFLVHGVDLLLEQLADPVGGHLMEHPHAALTQQLPASVHGVEHEGEVMTAEGLFNPVSGVCVGMSRLYPGSQPPAGGDACGRCRCAAERNSMSGQGNLLPGSVGPGPAAVPGRGRGMTETENL